MAKERTLEATSTWAVAVVCFVLVAISILIEQLIHHTGSWLKKKRKPSMYEALEKIKAELMLLGFISLLLTVLQESIADICVPRSVAHSWHPCSNYKDSEVYDDPCLAKGKVQFVSPYGIHQLHIFIFVLALAHVLYCVVTYGLGLLRAILVGGIWADGSSNPVGSRTWFTTNGSRMDPGPGSKSAQIRQIQDPPSHRLRS